MFIMVFHIRGIIKCLCNVSWDNSHVLRLGLLRYQICGNHNLNREKHSNSMKDASHLNVLTPLLIRKGSTVHNYEEDYRILYRFPHIAICGYVNGIKKHFTTVMAVGVPTSYLLKIMDVISSDTFLFFISQGGVICCILYSVGLIFYKLVGSVYLSSDGSTVKISYLDFWGKRVDVCCPLSDVIPLTEMNEGIEDVYVNMRRYSTPKKLRLTVRYGCVLDTKLFTDVFGNTDEIE